MRRALRPFKDLYPRPSFGVGHVPLEVAAHHGDLQRGFRALSGLWDTKHPKKAGKV